MAPSAPLSLAKRTLAIVVSVLLPVQPKKTGIFGDFTLAHSTMILFLSSGASIEVSPVEPMMRTADVPLSSWNLRSERNAAKSTDPSLLNGVMRAANEPVRSFLDIVICCLRGGSQRDDSMKLRRSGRPTAERKRDVSGAKLVRLP